LIATRYERHNDIVGNRAFEFDVSTHTIRDDIRVLELKYSIYTRMGAGGGVFILDSSRLQQRWLTVRQRELLISVCDMLDDKKALLMKSIIGGLSP
jgi:predicted DNA-binding transcriptional regulator YafY